MLIIQGVSREVIQSLTQDEAATLWEMYRAGLWGNLGNLISAHTAYAQMHQLIQVVQNQNSGKKTRLAKPDTFNKNNPRIAALLGESEQKKTFTIEDM